MSTPPAKAGAPTGTKRVMRIDSSGPQTITVGTATRMPSASVVPSWAWIAAIAISGPGCGGMSPCSTDRPASAGMAMRISGSSERCVTSTITGSSRTRPISKNIGMPMMIATSAIAHGNTAGDVRVSSLSIT